ncbi:MAG: tRNA adenosine(34) deaminase TadA [Proteobacteria bacterium]|nr:tRNA adenosine(34) deaminase TadA [Pseudomonadota bacterium]
MTGLNPSSQDLAWMQLAQSLARHASTIGEVPVGAVLVAEGKLLATGYNLRETLQLSTAHAELLAIEQACRTKGSWRLTDCDLYVTLEPCLMCAGAIYQTRLRRVWFGAFDPKAGALGSLYQIHEDQRLNHRYSVQGGLLGLECGEQLSNFFAIRRKQSSKMKKS